MSEKSSISSDPDQLATSFVPAILRRQYANNLSQPTITQVKEDYATLLWIDICNFSPLCNRLMKDTASGVEKLTGILQSHYDFVMNIIAWYGGEPLFFAGDGLMSAWPGNENRAHQSVPLAAACAHKILTSRTTVNDKGELISIHAIISTGAWQMAELVGIRDNRLFSFYGEVFSDLALAAKNKAPDRLLISDKALSFLDKELRSLPVEFETSILIDIPTDIVMPEINNPDLNEEAILQLHSFIPLTLTYPLNRERLKWIAEIRPVTILFLRLPNNNKTAAENLNQLHESVSLVTPLVLKYDGLLNQTWIDEKESNMLICFGPPPSAHIDNPERSVRLAFEIQTVLLKAGFDNSIGICSGMAYCGILGNDILRQNTVIGEVVNLSAHIAGIKMNAIFCDKATYSTTNNKVSYKGPVVETIKGRTVSVQLYMPESILGDDLVKSNISFSIGREHELGVLVDAFVRASNKKASCIIVEGGSGIGKTRLLEDFKARGIPSDGMLLSASGNFISRNTPYSILNTIFSSLLGLDKIKEDKNEAYKVVESKYGSRACLLNAVLHADFPVSPEIKNLTGGQKVAATHDFLLELLKEESSRRTLVIVIDDAQWMDETSWQLVESFNSGLNSYMLVLSFQKIAGIPQVGTLKKINAEHIVLKELTDSDQEKLICARLGVGAISDDVSHLVRKIAKGNPFFCIELAGSLLEQELLLFKDDNCSFVEDAHIEKISLPETVRGAVRMRIDRLGHGSQLSLKVGSVVGNRFGKRIVSNIYPIVTERELVPSYLEDATQAGFIHDMVVDNLEGYLFDNATIADVAYEMTLAEQRRHLHRESAEWYENYYNENLQPFYVGLAHHWLEAGEKNKAAGYYEKEAIRLFSLGFVKQALHIGLEGVRMLDHIIERDPAAIRAKIGEHLGAIGSLMSTRSVESLIDHNKLEDRNSEEVIKMLLELSPFAHQSQQVELFALMPISCLRITLEQGNGKSAAEVYAMYAVIHKALTGDSTAAFAWSNLALEVDNKNHNTLQARVSFIHCWFIAHWLVPVKTLIPLASRAADAGFQSGDIMYACFNLSLCVVLKVAAGIALDEVIQTAETYSIRNNQAVLNAAFHLLHEAQVAKALQGLTTGYTSLTDEKYDETTDIASICNTDLYNQIGYYLVSKLKLHAHFGNWKEAVEWGDKALPLLPAFASQPGHIDLEQFYTLACLYRAAETEDGASANFMNTANAGIDKIKAWAGLCAGNFLHKQLLLEAIREGLIGKASEAEKLFALSAEKALASGYLQDAGLAYEHLARMLHRLERDHKKALLASLEAYKEWGAEGKVTYLNSQYQV